MTGRAAAILVLMLSLPAAAHLVAADGVDADTIRLPSDGGDGLATNKGGEEQTPPDKVVAPTESAGGALEAEKPWACCNNTVCKESLPPVCRCLDKVKECAAACELCEPSGINHVCNDWYRGDPGPMCA
ncbi:hypothetical protein CFC21_063018 [Triticum aestivum]|uniref:Bowman-Birk serine protease inhibitors family domain-containing protein n=4 Tax=Triticinae TaxID=1648030 RepID=A0A453IXI2_AEGTS|nr:Bowman-Birk type trypsin inhibitor [Aegilops tauschii subsp. strangulata]XP_044376672.1 Bowman-Birk type trypsin inhibitor-like [Triticum aestivum]XP_044376673.1 Bowman-Birk type trypsin inhibitor-like [Triticum aestivum]KAF7055497.1 hypothetical protein CFC21_063018 [Triticum aestivum]